jgi:hypothetical protein
MLTTRAILSSWSPTEIVWVMKLFQSTRVTKKSTLSSEKGVELFQPVPERVSTHTIESDEPTDARRRLFLKGLVMVVGTLFVSSLFPKKAEALIMGGTPSTGVVGLKNSGNVRIDPAVLQGNSITRYSTVLSSSGTVRTPTSGKSLRIYTCKFSLDTSMTSVSFRFTSGGTDFEKYFGPVTGGLYGTNSHPNYISGGVNQDLYCLIVGTGNVQVNIDYLEV